MSSQKDTETTEEDAIRNHEWIQFIGKLNATACYKHALLARNPTIEKYCILDSERAHYNAIRDDFVKKYRWTSIIIKWQYWLSGPSDCTLM
jgi:hypothetical protein